MQENDSASFQGYEKSMHLLPKSQSQRGVHFCVTFLYCVDAAFFPTSRESLAPDAPRQAVHIILTTWRRRCTLYFGGG